MTSVRDSCSSFCSSERAAGTHLNIAEAHVVARASAAVVLVAATPKR